MEEKKFIYLLSTKFSSKTDWQANGVCYNSLEDVLRAAVLIVEQLDEEKIFFVHKFSYEVISDRPKIELVLVSTYYLHPLKV